jgi:hypothetical protein
MDVLIKSRHNCDQHKQAAVFASSCETPANPGLDLFNHEQFSPATEPMEMRHNQRQKTGTIFISHQSPHYRKLKYPMETA